MGRWERAQRAGTVSFSWSWKSGISTNLVLVGMIKTVLKFSYSSAVLPSNTHYTGTCKFSIFNLRSIKTFLGSTIEFCLFSFGADTVVQFGTLRKTSSATQMNF